MDSRRIEEAKSKHSKLLSECGITSSLLDELKSMSTKNLEKFNSLTPSERLESFSTCTEFQDALNQHLLQINCKLESFINDLSSKQKSLYTEKPKTPSLKVKSFASKEGVSENVAFVQNDSKSEELHSATSKVITESQYSTTPEINVLDIKSFIEHQDMRQNIPQTNKCTLKKSTHCAKVEDYSDTFIPVKKEDSNLNDSSQKVQHISFKNVKNIPNNTEANILKNTNDAVEIIGIKENTRLHDIFTTARKNDKSGLKKRAPPTMNSVCTISHIENPGHFYIQVIEEDSGYLESLELQLNECYNIKSRSFNDKVIARQTIEKYCVAYDEEWEGWYRGEIVNWDLPGNLIKCVYVDYGIPREIDFENIRELTEEFCQLHILAQRCHFAYLYPPGSTSTNKLPESEWPKESTKLFVKLVHNTIPPTFQLTFVDDEGDSTAVDMFPLNSSDENDVTIGLILINADAAKEILPANTDVIQNQILIDQICTAQGLSDENSEDWAYEDDEEESNVNIAVIGYDPKDEARTCKFLRPDGTCFKGNKCLKSHDRLHPDGYTSDEVQVYVEPLKPLILPGPNETREVLITHVIDIRTFYVQFKNDPFQSVYGVWTLKDLVKNLNSPETLKSLKKHKFAPAIGEIVVALHWSKFWHRGRVQNLFLPHQEKDAFAQIFFVDYGDVHEVKLKDLRQITKKYLNLPFQATLSHLSNIDHKNGVSTESEIAYMEERLMGTKFTAKIISSAVDVLHLQLSNDKWEDIGESIINAGFAVKNERMLFLKESETLLVD